MRLETLVELLGDLAPLELAAPWDNVGLLIEPLAPRAVTRALLTIDLTQAVLHEAELRGVELVVAYHPPLFAGVKRITRDSREGAVVLGALALNLAVYSPHTALDAVRGGVNDWLAEAFGQLPALPLEPSAVSSEQGQHGQGRHLVLPEPISLQQAIDALKVHLGVPSVRVAASTPERAIQSVALCAGAGGSVLMDHPADLYLTGEMRHHDVLELLRRGSSVVLTEHSHSERGYLARFAQLLQGRAGAVDWCVALADREPLSSV